MARLDSYRTPGPGRWVLQAACAGLPTDHFFSDDPGDISRALAVCRPCPVREDCAAYALAIPILDGVWGGLTETQRRRIRRSHERHEVHHEWSSRMAVPSPTTASDAPRYRT